MRRTLVAGLATTLLVATACASPPTAGDGDGDAETGAEATGGEGTDAAEDGGGDTGGRVEEILAELEGMEGEERRSRLVELAAEEGELSLYTSMNGDIVQGVADAFEEEYDIGVGVYRASSESVLQRLLQENDAGYAGADVAETNGTEMYALSQAGALRAVDVPAEENLAEGAEFEDWTATRFNFFAGAWNTQQVAEGEAPTTWEDFADPTWDGRLAVELGDSDWYMGLSDYWTEQGKSEEEIQQLFTDIAEGAVAVSGHTLITELLTAGEFAASTSNYSYIVQSQVDEGAPIAWEPPVEPVIARPNGVGILKNPAHPAAALLFFEWVLSDGQDVLAENAIDASRKDLLSTGDSVVATIDLAKYTENAEQLEKEYEELMRLAEQGSGS